MIPRMRSNPMRRLLLSLALTALFGAPLAAQGIAGLWDAGMETPGGTSKFTILFAVKGDSLSGTVTRSSGAQSPLFGTIKSDTVRFAYDIDYNGNTLTLSMVARVAADSMAGTVNINDQANETFWARKQKKPAN